MSKDMEFELKYKMHTDTYKAFLAERKFEEVCAWFIEQKWIRKVNPKMLDKVGYSVRIRKEYREKALEEITTKYSHTIKYFGTQKDNPNSAIEIENDIGENTFVAINEMYPTLPTVIKKRYELECSDIPVNASMTADVYLLQHSNKGKPLPVHDIINIEIEFQSQEEMDNFVEPLWLVPFKLNQ